MVRPNPVLTSTSPPDPSLAVRRLAWDRLWRVLLRPPCDPPDADQPVSDGDGDGYGVRG